MGRGGDVFLSQGFLHWIFFLKSDLPVFGSMNLSVGHLDPNSLFSLGHSKVSMTDSVDRPLLVTNLRNAAAL